MLLTRGLPTFTQGALIWLKSVTNLGPALLYNKRKNPLIEYDKDFRADGCGYQICIY